MPPTNSGVPLRVNTDVEWSEFDSEWYYRQFYRQLPADDIGVLQLMRDFFGDHAAGLPSDAKGVDVGTGPNLYPALAMLPFCATIDLHEPGEQNIKWLDATLADDEPQWTEAWDVFRRHPAYAGVSDHWSELRRKARVFPTSVLEPREPQWHIGTMFFVAESITENHDEFRQAVWNFVGGLMPGAPFAIGFMVGSTGYRAGDEKSIFPAVCIEQADVQDVLSKVSDELHIHHIGTEFEGRQDYQGMLLALGTAVPQV